MPKELIPADWVQKPCPFLLPPDSPAALSCGDCEGEFSMWSRRHCMFCGHVFHSSQCTQKIKLEGEFFKQRICRKCHYYRESASHHLKIGEAFDCISSQGTASPLTISLEEATAELILHWRSSELKETIDLENVEVRKGFSHMNQHMNSTGGNYEPLRSLSLFLTDSAGEHYAHHLKATSARTCQNWVEGLKAAKYVYQKMKEQDKALIHYTDQGKNLSSHRRWYRKLYLPLPRGDPGTTTSGVSDARWSPCEEWEDIPLPTSAGVSHSFVSTSTLHSSTSGSASPFTISSGNLSDLSLSMRSSTTPQRHSLTVHSLNLPPRNHTNSRKQPSTQSLPPTPGLLPSSLCHCRSYRHTHMPLPETPKTLDHCCDECRDWCRIAMDLDNW